MCGGVLENARSNLPPEFRSAASTTKGGVIAHVISSGPGASRRALSNSVSAATTNMPAEGFHIVDLAVFGGAVAQAYSNMPSELSSTLSATSDGAQAHIPTVVLAFRHRF